MLTVNAITTETEYDKRTRSSRRRPMLIPFFAPADIADQAGDQRIGSNGIQPLQRTEPGCGQRPPGEAGCTADARFAAAKYCAVKLQQVRLTPSERGFQMLTMYGRLLPAIPTSMIWATTIGTRRSNTTSRKLEQRSDGCSLFCSASSRLQDFHLLFHSPFLCFDIDSIIAMINMNSIVL